MAKKNVSAPPVSHISATYRFTIPRSTPLAAQIAAGGYDCSNADINEQNFPQVEGEKDEEVEDALFHFGPITSDEVVAKMAKEGYEPEELPALLALDAAQPELHRQFLIIALGSVWVHLDGARSVPYLSEYSGSRGLLLARCGYVWSGDCRFLGRRLPVGKAGKRNLRS